MAEGSEGQHPRRPGVDAPGRSPRRGPGSLTAKLAVCVVAFGLMGAGLLSTRQSRLQAAHEVTAARLRIRDHDERLLTLRAEIAERVNPSAVREMLAKKELEGLTPIAGRTRWFDVARNDTGELITEDDEPAGEPMPDEIRELLDELNRLAPDGPHQEEQDQEEPDREDRRNERIRLGP